MSNIYRRRRVVTVIVIAVIPVFLLIQQLLSQPTTSTVDKTSIETHITEQSNESLALAELEKLEIKDHDSKNGYERKQFGNGWSKWSDCDTRQKILIRDLTDIVFDTDNCTVLSGILNDPYTGKIIHFTRGKTTSGTVQIDHVIALSNAWQTGAQYLDFETRVELANDDLELIAVDGKSNSQKSDGDAATWLPTNIAFRCQYVARQIAVKVKYELWVTDPEYDAMKKVLSACPDQRLPSP